MPIPNPVVHCNPNIMSGTAVFRGTRVPAVSLFDYLAAGHTIDYFLAQFPTVSKDQAVEALAQSRDQLLARARSPR